MTEHTTVSRSSGVFPARQIDPIKSMPTFLLLLFARITSDYSTIVPLTGT